MNSLKKPLSIADLAAMKQRGEKIACLTAYDASFSALLDRASIDLILVGDSLGMTIQGHDSTIPVTLNDMAYHTRCVSMTRNRAFVVADLPFMSYPTPLQAAQSAARLLRNGAQMVKLEGTRLETVQFLASQGIPTCGHLGLLPQSIHRLGRYHVQGTETHSADQIIADAQTLEQAGIQLLVLECVPRQVGKTISEKLTIHVIGIGEGIGCDGQVLVLHDLLGISLHKCPRFAKNFMENAPSIAEAIADYQQAVKQARFPGQEHCF